MPHHLHRLLGVAILDGRDIDEVVVGVRRLIAQEAHDVVQRVGRHEHGGVTPHDVGAHDGRTETLAQRGDARILRTATMRRCDAA
jgi:hypothetical protein